MHNSLSPRTTTSQEAPINTPAVWKDDPGCGHTVASAYQTHYCSYIRVPRLLTLQQPRTPDELLLIIALQWFELWFKVLLTDARAARVDRGATFETTKLLRRGIELFKLFDTQLAFDENVLVRELHVFKTLRDAQGLGFSSQFAQLKPLHSHAPDLDEYNSRLRSFRARFARFIRATLIPRPSRASCYEDWLRLPQLLALQNAVKADWTEVGQPVLAHAETENVGPDENMFVVVHQCFELWFKFILDQMDRAIVLIQANSITDANHLLRRVVEIERLLVQQIEIPATMLPLDFGRFREERIERDGKTFVRGLAPASGTESYQFREIEIVGGLRDDTTFRKYLNGSEQLPIRLLTPRQAERLNGPTLPEAFHAALAARGIARLQDLFTAADVPNPNADLAELADTLVAFDEQFRFWRLAHVSMVEKMIGGKSGTGLLGPEYLMETAGLRSQADLRTRKNRILEDIQTRPRFFEDLWAVRTKLGMYS